PRSLEAQVTDRASTTSIISTARPSLPARSVLAVAAAISSGAAWLLPSPAATAALLAGGSATQAVSTAPPRNNTPTHRPGNWVMFALPPGFPASIVAPIAVEGNDVGPTLRSGPSC